MTGSVMERSHAKLTRWAMGFWLAASSKKGFSAHQVHRALGCQYNTARFMHHRIMEAMRQGGLDQTPMGRLAQTSRPFALCGESELAKGVNSLLRS